MEQHEDHAHATGCAMMQITAITEPTAILMLRHPQSPLPLSRSGSQCIDTIMHVVALGTVLYLLRASVAWIAPNSTAAPAASLLFADAAVVRDARGELHMFDAADPFPSQSFRQSQQMKERRDKEHADSSAREAAAEESHSFETAASTLAAAARSVKRRWDDFTQLGWQSPDAMAKRRNKERAAACAAAAKIGPRNRLPAPIHRMRAEHRWRHLKSPSSTPVLYAHLGFGSMLGLLIAVVFVVGGICLCAAFMDRKRRAAREAEAAQQQRRASMIMQPLPPTSYVKEVQQPPPPPYDNRAYPPPGYEMRGGYAPAAYPQRGQQGYDPYGPAAAGPPQGYPSTGYPPHPYGYPPQSGGYPATVAMPPQQAHSGGLGGLGGMAASGLGGFGLGTLMGHGLGSMFGGHRGGGYGVGGRDPEYADDRGYGGNGGGGGEFAAEEGPPMDDVDLGGGGDDGGTFDAES